MHWNSVSEFFAMGGYGLYVWGSMGVTAGVMAAEAWACKLGRAQALQQVRQSILAHETTEDWHG